MTSHSTLDLRTLDSAICAHSVGGVGENHRMEHCYCGATSGGAELEMRAAERATAKLLDENVDEAQRARDRDAI
jgi:hypothetical protein